MHCISKYSPILAVTNIFIFPCNFFSFWLALLSGAKRITHWFFPDHATSGYLATFFFFSQWQNFAFIPLNASLVNFIRDSACWYFFFKIMIFNEAFFVIFMNLINRFSISSFKPALQMCWTRSLWGKLFRFLLYLYHV